jgi:preprotein translocase subunit SecA
VVDDLADRYESGQPVLVGTVSVEKSELLSNQLRKRGIPHEVLNAKQHTREAEIVAQAGRLHAVTVATNMAGRGVDIILGGNPEGLAGRELRAEGLDPESDEGRARYRSLLEKYEPETRAEGEKIRDLGGLYVLGTERHESRRIDNQLRGRSGRQGDPGESRFYLSLEDELMRLFATGAMSWVMGKALPDDVPIEAKMVSKAIERAQNTVEARNAEIRKNVLKYDEVMNEQRKVIYRRRNQILEGHDLRDEAIESLETALENTVRASCVSDAADEWDLEGLVAQLNEFYPTRFSVADLAQTDLVEEIVDAVQTEALEHYEAREAEFGAEDMRQIERQVMLRVIDTHWREHLLEMDYLQEGIHLRAMGQKDPLVEWQQDGYAMFGEMVDIIAEDFVKYIMHLQVVHEGAASTVEEARNVQTSGPEQLQGSDSMRQAAAMAPIEGEGEGDAPMPIPNQPDVMTPIVKSDEERIGRNEPCSCGSGKKYKHCHGR